jgi:hypothetical protein
MRESTTAEGRRRTRRGTVWPAASLNGPGVRPIAPRMPRPVSLGGPTAHAPCDLRGTIPRHQGRLGVQSPSRKG